jgi:TolB-like protein/tetratricopeptide (TPR) repeat protein
VSDASKAVFLSYASQDAEAARKICEALRAVGVEVWFDQSELVGGDAWDAKIRGQIKACALFVPLISASTQARREGYFRIEWKLAAQRTHAIADGTPFLLPVVIDQTGDAESLVPAEFREVQWTRLRPAMRDYGGPLRQAQGGQARDEASLAAFGRRVKALLEPGDGAAIHQTGPSNLSHGRFRELSVSRVAGKSIAVLAFANLSPDPENEYFSDGLSEDLIDLLGRVPGLTVRGRTSAFSFKGRNVPMPEIARQLDVAYVVRGSVRKAGNRVRITAQLTRALDDQVVWSSPPLERELQDVFAVQDEVVALIAQNLSLQLGGAARVQKTVNPETHRLVLEGHYFWNRGSAADMDRGEAAFAQAAAIEPDSAEAQAGLAKVSVLRIHYGWLDANPGDPAELRHARDLASRAVGLDPKNPDALAVQATVHMLEGKFDESETRFREALALNPNAPLPRLWHALLLASRGQLAAALAENSNVIALEPLWFPPLQLQQLLLVEAHRFAESLLVAERVTAVQGGSYVPNLLYRVAALRGLGRDAEAVALARLVRARLAERPRWAADCFAVEALRLAGDPGEAEAYVKELLDFLPHDAPIVRGSVRAVLGRWDEAQPDLEKMPVLGRRSLFWHSLWDPWRDDARFHHLLEVIGCAEDYKVARAELARLVAEEAELAVKP